MIWVHGHGISVNDIALDGISLPYLNFKGLNDYKNVSTLRNHISMPSPHCRSRNLLLRRPWRATHPSHKQYNDQLIYAYHVMETSTPRNPANAMHSSNIQRKSSRRCSMISLDNRICKIDMNIAVQIETGSQKLNTSIDAMTNNVTLKKMCLEIPIVCILKGVYWANMVSSRVIQALETSIVCLIMV